MLDRSTSSHRRHPPIDAKTVETIIALRRHRLRGNHTAVKTGVFSATVSRVLRKIRLSRLSHLGQSKPVRRLVREHLGELIHLDTKTLVRFNGVGHRISGNRKGQSNRRRIGGEDAFASLKPFASA